MTVRSRFSISLKKRFLVLSRKNVQDTMVYGYKLNPEGLTQEEVDKYYDEKIADRLTYKLCKAYQFEYSTIVQNLIDILNWRREFNPLSCAYKEVHNTELQNVGILTFDANGDANKKAVTWNLYGQLVKKKNCFKMWISLYATESGSWKRV